MPPLLMPHYFAYGTNCDPAVMAHKGVAFHSSRRATLPGYRLLFNKRSMREKLPASIGFANIEALEDGVIEGVLYELADDAALARLDETERYPEHYRRLEVVVQTDAGDVTCWVYQAQPDKTAEGLVPSRNYLDHILAGREFLSQQYFEAIDQSQTYQDECACCGRWGEIVFVREDEHLHAICQSCREARIKWGDVLRRALTVNETRAVMTELVMQGEGYPSIEALIDDAIARKLV